MQYKLRPLLVLLCALLAPPSLAQDVGDGSTNGDLNTNMGDNNTVDSNNPSESVTNNYNSGAPGAMSNPVPSAMAPTMMGGGGNESCLIPSSTGVQISIVGVSRGEMVQDPECNRRRDARLMGTPQTVGGLGLQVSGISVMCRNAQVFKAMALSATPCPILDVASGRLLLGREAYEKYRGNPSVFVVGYAEDKLFWDTILRIGEELPDVQTNDSGPSLSARFRRDSGSDDDGPKDRRPTD